jgi:hypothetical protein
MVMVDEVSMLSAQFLFLLDTRLRSMYNSDQTFGGISILLIGYFIQLPVTTGRDLWSVMYGTVSGKDGTACNLFQKFPVKGLTANIGSSECVCVNLTFSRGGLPSDAVPTARQIHPPQLMQHHTLSDSTHQFSPGENVNCRLSLGNVDRTVSANS